MRRKAARPVSGPGTGGDTAAVDAVARSFDVGLALSIYERRDDGSIVEIGNPASPLSMGSSTATWPTEQ